MRAAAMAVLPENEALLSTSMKSVGEAMSIGWNFAESLQKALRWMETGLTGLNEVAIPGAESLGAEGTGADGSGAKDAIRAALTRPTPDRLLVAAQAFRHGLPIAADHAA